jgi:hypothetical protein
VRYGTADGRGPATQQAAWSCDTAGGRSVPCIESYGRQAILVAQWPTAGGRSMPCIESYGRQAILVAQ